MFVIYVLFVNFWCKVFLNILVVCGVRLYKIIIWICFMFFSLVIIFLMKIFEFIIWSMFVMLIDIWELSLLMIVKIGFCFCDVICVIYEFVVWNCELKCSVFLKIKLEVILILSWLVLYVLWILYLRVILCKMGFFLFIFLIVKIIVLEYIRMFGWRLVYDLFLLVRWSGNKFLRMMLLCL